MNKRAHSRKAFSMLEQVCQWKHTDKSVSANLLITGKKVAFFCIAYSTTATKIPYFTHAKLPFSTSFCPCSEYHQNTAVEQTRIFQPLV